LKYYLEYGIPKQIKDSNQKQISQLRIEALLLGNLEGKIFKEGVIMKKYFFYCLILSLLLSSKLMASNFNFALSSNLSNVTGDTTYNIKFSEYDQDYGRIEGESELEFEINAVMLNVQADFSFKDDFLIFSFIVGQTVSTTDGNLRDRDWIRYGSYEYLYGDTDSSIESDGEMYEWKAAVNFLEFGRQVKFKLGASAGYQKQKWGTFKTRNVEGFYLDDYLNRDYFKSYYQQDVLTYEVEYDIVYSGIALQVYFNDKFMVSCNLDLGIVHAEDEDNHVLREKISTGDADGLYTALKTKANYQITSNFSVSANLDFISIETDGDQTQTFYNGNIRTDQYFDIDDEITSEQIYIGITAKLTL